MCWKASSFSTGASRNLCNCVSNFNDLSCLKRKPTPVSSCLLPVVLQVSLICQRLPGAKHHYKGTVHHKNTSICFPSMMHFMVKLLSCGKPERIDGNGTDNRVSMMSSFWGFTFFVAEIISGWRPPSWHTELLGFYCAAICKEFLIMPKI